VGVGASCGLSVLGSMHMGEAYVEYQDHGQIYTELFSHKSFLLRQSMRNDILLLRFHRLFYVHLMVSKG
jgi:hypothetical protein